MGRGKSGAVRPGCMVRSHEEGVQGEDPRVQSIPVQLESLYCIYREHQAGRFSSPSSEGGLGCHGRLSGAGSCHQCT